MCWDVICLVDVYSRSVTSSGSRRPTFYFLESYDWKLEQGKVQTIRRLIKWVHELQIFSLYHIITHTWTTRWSVEKRIIFITSQYLICFQEGSSSGRTLLPSKVLRVREYLSSFSLSQARIKKIMQADEEVGKIAMATPVLICMFF